METDASEAVPTVSYSTAGAWDFHVAYLKLTFFICQSDFTVFSNIVWQNNVPVICQPDPVPETWAVRCLVKMVNEEIRAPIMVYWSFLFWNFLLIFTVLLLNIQHFLLIGKTIYVSIKFEHRGKAECTLSRGWNFTRDALTQSIIIFEVLLEQ